jgi:hypothetical protein
VGGHGPLRLWAAWSLERGLWSVALFLKISHAIHLGELSITSENIAIPTMKIHGLK